MKRLAIHALVSCLVLASTVGLAFAQSDLSPAQRDFFEKKIRPVLIDECYSCHSADADDVEGGLWLDTRAGIREGGDTGPAVVPGNVRRSLLVKAMRHIDDDMQMPPDKKLADDIIRDFEEWIQMGAPDPREGETPVARPEIDIAAGRDFWSFKPPVKHQPPAVKDDSWPLTDIDRFLLAELEQRGLKPVEDADPYTLVRRLYFDLIGLPPKPSEVNQFVRRHREDAQQAILETVNQLLESPQFGERWGRHWLDVARYAESSGGASNLVYPHAWRYRDYVIEAFNQDKPFDQFVREQIAGDLYRENDDEKRAEKLVATGFLAIGTKSHNERNRRQFAADLADEQIDATFQAFQALTVACARCHDHKFDPIPQSDYYALAGIFLSTETHYGTVRMVQSNHPSQLLELPSDANAAVPDESLNDRQRRNLERQIGGLEERLDEISRSQNPAQRIFVVTRLAQLRSQLSMYDDEGNPKAFAMGARDRRFTTDTRLLVRGEIDQPSERVQRGFPQVLTDRQPRIRRRSSGRRELAEWLASEENPLTARVMANRVWLHLIGQGLVATPDNFGASGIAPTHPELLDYLAVSFMDSEWSVKQLIRSVVTSRAYQMASNFDETNYAADPDNNLVWRIPKRRLEAEALRDTMLLLSGRLDQDAPVGSKLALSGDGNVNRLLTGDPSAGHTNRTVYLPIARDMLPEVLSVFDFPDPSLISGARATTTIPSQALYMMNSPFVIQQAEGLTTRLLSAPGNETAKVRLAYQLCYSRLPSSGEASRARKFLTDYGREHSTRATWSAFCQALFASAEFAQK